MATRHKWGDTNEGGAANGENVVDRSRHWSAGDGIADRGGVLRTVAGVVSAKGTDCGMVIAKQ